MKRTKHRYSAIRLAFAGLLSVIMLFWILLIGALPPLIITPGTYISPWPILMTSILAVLILVLLSPIVFFGIGGERWASISLGIFPCLVLLWILGRGVSILEWANY